MRLPSKAIWPAWPMRWRCRSRAGRSPGWFAPSAISAAAQDAELGAALAARNARRRALLGVLVDRQGVAAGQAKADMVDLLFTLTSFATFSSLRNEQRDGAAVCALLLPLCDRILSGAADTAPSG